MLLSLIALALVLLAAGLWAVRRGHSLPGKVVTAGAVLMLLGPLGLFTVGAFMWTEQAQLTAAAWAAWAAQLGGFCLALAGLFLLALRGASRS